MARPSTEKKKHKAIRSDKEKAEPLAEGTRKLVDQSYTEASSKETSERADNLHRQLSSDYSS